MNFPIFHSEMDYGLGPTIYPSIKFREMNPIEKKCRELSDMMFEYIELVSSGRFTGEFDEWLIIREVLIDIGVSSETDPSWEDIDLHELLRVLREE